MAQRTFGIPMHLLLLILLVFLPISTAEVTCRVACKKCKDSSDNTKMVEIYCAMCKECNERKKERTTTTDHRQSHQSWQLKEIDYPAGCPTPPPCDYEDSEDYEIIKPPHEKRTTTTTTTTRKPCPPIKPCRRRTSHPPSYPCIPCMPMCPSYCPNPYNYPTPASQYVPTTVPSDYLYVYVGVPKNVLKKSVVESLKANLGNRNLSAHRVRTGS